jgi:hypothetical protein
MTTLCIENESQSTALNQRTHKSMRGWFLLACLDPNPLLVCRVVFFFLECSTYHCLNIQVVGGFANVFWSASQPLVKQTKDLSNVVGG